MKKQKLLFVLAVGVFFASLTILISPSVSAAATIIVDSTADTIADDGVCTLREAITSANADAALGADPNECEDGSGTDAINFVISGTGVHTIVLASALPDITSVVNINGYSESDASVNTAVSPQPLTGNLVIEINGTNAGVGEDGIVFTGGATGAAGSSIRGIVINRFEGNGIVVAAQNVTITGNYIGTDPTGLIDRGNSASGITSDTNVVDKQGAIIGGTAAAARNLISANGTSGVYPVTDWVVQGNYVGVDASGEVALSNSTIGGSGGLSIDNCDGVIVGGTTVGAANVISGNLSHGIAPLDSTNMTIQGNLVGTDWTGTVAIPNANGVTFGGDHTGSVLGGTSSAARNIISGNSEAGILSGTTGGLRIEGNYIGLNITGDSPIPNGTYGVAMGGTTEILGGSIAARNVISGNTQHNIGLFAFPPFLGTTVTGNKITGNYIGTDKDGNINTGISAVQGAGVVYSASVDGNIIGGTSTSDSNRIAGNRGYGIGVRTYIGVNAATWDPSNTAILGNQIYGNTSAGYITDGEGLGIDHYTVTDDEPNFIIDSMAGLGPTLNDTDDTDSGPNNFINFPVINNAVQNGTSMSVNLDLDANNADTSNNTFRVEFFSNDAADPSGYGEGRTYLGYANVSNGDNQVMNVTIPNGTDLTGKVLSATTTAINTATASDFGASSEFSLASSNITIVASAATSNTPLVNTGDSIRDAIVLSVFLVSSTSAIVIAKRRQVYRISR